MHADLEDLFDCTAIERIWRGLYSRGVAGVDGRLRGLDLACGQTVPVCLGTAAAFFGFDTENTTDLHVLNPGGHQLRPAEGLIVHRRDGAPLITVSGRPATAPSWTAVEVARSLGRPRALATLDAALRSGRCTEAGLESAVAAQSGRRGIVTVRELLPHSDGRAESPMESEARLVMIDGGLPVPVLQHEVVDGRGRLRRLDFAWPRHKVAAEYDSDQWHVGADALRRVVRQDVRRRPRALVERIRAHLDRVPVG